MKNKNNKINISNYLALLTNTHQVTKNYLANGKIAHIKLTKSLTKYDIAAIAKRLRSKKARSDTINVRAGGQQQYYNVGKLIKQKNHHNGINNSITIRNVVDLASFEITMPIFTPLNSITLFAGKRFRAKSYYLRKCSPVKSKVEFTFAEA